MGLCPPPLSLCSCRPDSAAVRLATSTGTRATRPTLGPPLVGPRHGDPANFHPWLVVRPSHVTPGLQAQLDAKSRQLQLVLMGEVTQDAKRSFRHSHQYAASVFGVR